MNKFVKKFFIVCLLLAIFLPVAAKAQSAEGLASAAKFQHWEDLTHCKHPLSNKLIEFGVVGAN
jgi:hypothetical protein